MDAVILEIVIPLVIGLVTQFVWELVQRKRQQPPLRPRQRVIIVVLVAVVLALGLLFVPKIRVSSANWCSDADQSIKVTGRLTTSLLGTPAGDHGIQVKIFPVGEDRPIFPEKFVRTSADGTFTVKFPPLPSPLADKGYLINTAYQRYILSAWELWEKHDSTVGDLARCSTP